MLSSRLLARIRRVALELHPTRLEALATDFRRLDTTLNQGVVGEWVRTSNWCHHSSAGHR